MIEQVISWLSEVNRKQGVRLLIRNIRFSFAVKTEQDELYVKIDDGLVALHEAGESSSAGKRIEVSSDVLHSILTGERKLREAVKYREAATTCTFRELLLLESLFFLAKPDKTHILNKNLSK
ncbi:hypothetical protein [Bacillus tuaregi]|uniref:hypothetical protein n=1 Tax=Bacillus tuaregi TaxID=1816695 RepID=UPI0008F81B5F|nr:hypothetical protein [Bacillus tuaregi]